MLSSRGECDQVTLDTEGEWRRRAIKILLMQQSESLCGRGTDKKTTGVANLPSGHNLGSDQPKLGCLQEGV